MVEHASAPKSRALLSLVSNAVEREGCASGSTAGAAAMNTWRAADAALAPILGQSGVAALYKRSLQLTAVKFPWLADVQPERLLRHESFSSLREVLSRQSSSSAVNGSAALLQTLRQLLNNLVGPALTDRLLRSVAQHAVLEVPW